MKHIKSNYTKTVLRRTCDSKGSSIEETIRKAIASNAPLEGNAPTIFTEASEGVRPEYDIRTDKHEIALAANDKYQASNHMKGFIGATEYDENGFDGKKFKPNEQPKNE